VSTIVAIKLQATELAAVDELVRLGSYKSRSHFIRTAIFDLLRADGLKADVRQRILLERPTERRARNLPVPIKRSATRSARP
jgi:Arc/MetJ-type ribon-helix-helix transcriptional regulator